MKRAQQAVRIAEAAVRIVEKNGRFEKIDNVEGKPLAAEAGGFTIFYSTPFARLPGMDGYMIDIWPTGKQKIFSARWKYQISDLAIVNFKRGDWEKFFSDGS